MLAPIPTECDGLEDTELVRLTRCGHQEAFSELVRRYHHRVLRTTRSLVKSRDDANDLAQETFLKAYCSLQGFRGGSQFYTWLHRIGVNCALDWRKARRRRQAFGALVEQWERPGAAVSAPNAPDAGVTRAELHDALDRAIQDLSPEYRDTLVMREVDGLTCREVASELGCSEGTVKSRLFRAKRRLREILEPTYREWGE